MMLSRICKPIFIVLFQLSVAHAQKVITIEHEGGQDYIIKTLKIISDKSKEIKEPEPQNYIEKIVSAHQNQRMVISDSLFNGLYSFIGKQTFHDGKPNFAYGSFSIAMQNNCPVIVYYAEPPLPKTILKNIIAFLKPINSPESQKLIKECEDYLLL